MKPPERLNCRPCCQLKTTSVKNEKKMIRTTDGLGWPRPSNAAVTPLGASPGRRRDGGRHSSMTSRRLPITPELQRQQVTSCCHWRLDTDRSRRRPRKNDDGHDDHHEERDAVPIASRRDAQRELDDRRREIGDDARKMISEIPLPTREDCSLATSGTSYRRPVIRSTAEEPARIERRLAV